MQNVLKISIIDKTEEIQAIKKKYGSKYYFNDVAHKEAAHLWGAECNEHGVVMDWQEETVVKVGSCYASIKFAETAKGYCLIGLSGQTAISGFGYAPSVWDKQGFASYWDARAYGVQRLLSFFEKEAVSGNSCSSAKNKANALKAAELLKAELTPQLTLF